MENLVKNKTIIGLKYWNRRRTSRHTKVKNKTIIGLKSTTESNNNSATNS